MKKLILSLLLFWPVVIAFGQTNLNGVTFGFGAGYSGSFDKTYDYSLSTDGIHALKIQPLNKGAFVISSVVMVKLGKVAVPTGASNFVRQSPAGTNANFLEHLSIDLALNLVNISQDVSFNKSIDGGLGVGYFLSPELQIALFYDVSRVTQLRDYLIKEYQDKSIPTADVDTNGKVINYNALDTKNTDLFYNKTISGLSLKLVFSIANKKAP